MSVTKQDISDLLDQKLHPLDNRLGAVEASMVTKADLNQAINGLQADIYAIPGRVQEQLQPILERHETKISQHDLLIADIQDEMREKFAAMEQEISKVKTMISSPSVR